MAGRITLEVALVAIMTLLISFALFGILALTNSDDPIGTLIDQVPRILFGLLGVGLGLWIIMVVIGAIAHRYRGAGWRIGTHLVSIVVAMIVNAVVIAVVALTTGGGELLIAGIAVGAGMVVVVASVPAILITELLLIRPRSVTRPAAGSVSTTA